VDERRRGDRHLRQGGRARPAEGAVPCCCWCRREIKSAPKPPISRSISAAPQRLSFPSRPDNISLSVSASGLEVGALHD
jgi:hypothetical protein